MVGRGGVTAEACLRADRPAFAAQRPQGRPVGRPPQGRERHLVEAEDRSTLARPALPLRPLADLLRPLRALEARWHMGSPPFPSADQIRCCRGG
jgi:hypothetical protein